MRSFMLAALILIGAGQSAWAGDPTPFFPAPSNAIPGSTYTTIVHPAPGVDYYYDNRGNSTTVYQVAPGMQAYTSRGPDNKITSQGNLYDQAPRHLEMPSIFTPPPGFYDPPATRR